MVKQISSTNNPLIKQIVLLKEKSRERKKQGLFIAEGQREIGIAVASGYTIQTLVFEPSILSENDVHALFDTSDIQLIEASKPVYEKIAYRNSTEGVLAIIKSKPHTLDQLSFENPNPLILVAEAPEKPGNIGALLRTADAANIDAVLIANPKTDLYNANIIRSSIGCVFSNKIATGTTTEIIDFLQQKGINFYGAALKEDSILYTENDYTAPTAIVIGTEDTGLSDEWLNNTTQNIIIPMQGKIDSMNLSVAAGILIFEAKRQRNFN